MQALSQLGVLLGTSWASGVNLYLTVAALGISDRMGWVELPGNLDAVSNPLVIGAAVLLYLIEFVADKIPIVDSAWDAVHTFIRPLGGAALAYMAASNAGPALQTTVALFSGAVALDSHLTKATTRVAMNSTVPEPITHSAVSLTEDALVAGVLWMIVQHPIIAGILVILFILFSVWFLKMMFRFLKKIFSFLFRSSSDRASREAAPSS
jgi:hypothetical protein